MAMSIFKKINAMLPDEVKNLVAPIIRQQLIGNEVFLSQYSELCDFDSLSIEEKRERQMADLRRVLEEAYANVPYYKEMFDSVSFSPNKLTDFKQLEAIPLLEKKTIQARFDDLLNPYRYDSYESTTGGSSGVATRISLDKDSIYRERAFIYHFWSKFGYNYKTSKLVTFRGIPGKKVKKSNPLYNEVQLTPFNLNRDTIREYIKEIDRFGAEFVQGYPSAIANFCLLAEEKKLRLQKKIKAIFLISENTQPWQQEVIKRYFDCPMAPFYGHTERAVFAECCNGLEGGYTFNPLYGYAEVLNDGSIVCTGFINQRMPLIRYKLDDEAIPLDNEFAYLINGHRDGAYIEGANGEQITQTSFEGMHSKLLSKLAAYQLVQKKKGECNFYFMTDHTMSLSDIDNLKEELKSGIACIEWIPEQVEHFVLTERGKFKPLLVDIQ